jgi:polar amino acid transport system substrate-binding protein
MKSFISSGFLLLFLTSLPIFAISAEIRYAVFPAPPYMINADPENAGEIRGIDVDIVKEIAKRMNLDIKYIKCPWARCLQLMESGQADLLSSAYKRPEREEFMFYFDKPFLDKLPIAFYFRRGSGVVIDKYEDLYKLKSVGVLQDAGYFKQFDKDEKVTKYMVPSQDQLFPMLLGGRFDVMAGYVPTENYRIIVEGYGTKVERSKYEYSETAYVYMALSKKSPLARRFKEFNEVNTDLFTKGMLTRIRDKYYKEYSLPGGSN